MYDSKKLLNMLEKELIMKHISIKFLKMGNNYPLSFIADMTCENNKIYKEFYKISRPTHAIKMYEKSIKNSDLYYKLGDIYYSKGEVEKATKSYSDCINNSSNTLMANKYLYNIHEKDTIHNQYRLYY